MLKRTSPNTLVWLARNDASSIGLIPTPKIHSAPNTSAHCTLGLFTQTGGYQLSQPQATQFQNKYHIFNTAHFRKPNNIIQIYAFQMFNYDSGVRSCITSQRCAQQAPTAQYYCINQVLKTFTYSVKLVWRGTYCRFTLYDRFCTGFE